MGSENDSDTAFDDAVPDGTPGGSAVPATAAALPIGIKVVVAGGFGVGKTTFVSTVSEIEPMSTEELLTEVSAATDRLTSTSPASTTPKATPRRVREAGCGRRTGRRGGVRRPTGRCVARHGP